MDTCTEANFCLNELENENWLWEMSQPIGVCTSPQPLFLTILEKMDVLIASPRRLAFQFSQQVIVSMSIMCS
jgi:hypothetical protein